MIVHIPISINCAELQYSINVLLRQFLGLEFEIVAKDIVDTVFWIGEKSLTITNHFFKNKIDSISATPDLFPLNIYDDYCEIGGDRWPLVTLYGDSNIENHIDGFTLHSDIIASTFFMLTRWEEYVDKTRDEHGRFPATASLAYRAGFLNRPVVNEYVELLWALLQLIGCTQQRKTRSYKLVPTHDVDKPYLFDGVKRSLRYLAGSVKRRRIGELTRYARHRIKNEDPFDTHDRLMDLAETHNSEAHFFLLQMGKTMHDESYDISSPKIKRLAKHIQERGHNIGFHPSYDTYDNEALFAKEKSYLEQNFDCKVDTGRHHFLRWDVSVTPQIWQKNNMAWDSTLGYADHAGFRCGVCYPFPLFDLVNRKQLEVYERPLIAMEWSLVKYQGLSIDEVEEEIENLRNQVKKYNGEFVFLYHNSAFFVDEYLTISERLLQAFYD